MMAPATDALASPSLKLRRIFDAPRELVWRDDHEDGAPVDTLVTALLTELPDGQTQRDFTQQGLKSEQGLAGHRQDWTGAFARLGQWLHTHGRTA
jgi:uncharacterized protein YndB with AHSA1/START domain